MEHYTKIDMAAWPRREHYRYYSQTLKVEFNMTAPVNVKKLLGFCRANGYRFYPAAIYCVTRTLGRIENFRMFRNADGELCVWDRVVPNYTIFHADDCTFSDCWTDFSDDFGTFYRAVTADMQTFGGNHGIKAKPGQPANFYCVSCTPWVSFTGCGSRVTGSSEPAFFPIIVMGRYEESGGAVRMPVALSRCAVLPLSSGGDGRARGLRGRTLTRMLLRERPAVCKTRTAGRFRFSDAPAEGALRQLSRRARGMRRGRPDRFCVKRDFSDKLHIVKSARKPYNCIRRKTSGRTPSAGGYRL